MKGNFMSRITYHISDVNNYFEKLRPVIEEALQKAIKITSEKIPPLENIEILFTGDGFKHYTSMEDHVSGHTVNSSTIIVYADDKATNKNIATSLFNTINHELNHALRWQYLARNHPDKLFSTGLFEDLIFEGLAVAYEEENAETLDYFTEQISKRRKDINISVLNKIRESFNSNNYDYEKLFFTGNKEENIPRWAAYGLGYYLVKKYMKNTEKKASELVGEPYDSFYSVL